jgi:NADPH:quinone reductase-like Zn-dependent oxidoreductase
MKAAIVRELGRPPEWSDFEDPIPLPGETIVSVSAAAVSQLALSRSSGTHYSTPSIPPFIAGVDGVGRTPEGKRVYFQFPSAPFGALAERTPVAKDELIPVPDALDDAVAAAAAIPGMSCWVPLTTFARIPPGESVLVNGATGASGRIAVQVARHLGAPHVIATGRDESQLSDLADLGADVVVPLGTSPDTLRERIRKSAHEFEVGIVLDYLWGPSSETILSALGGPNAPRGPSRIRYVQVGALAGDRIALSAQLLRSSGVEILGGGIGSSTGEGLRSGIQTFLDAFVQGKFRISTEIRSAAEVARYWGTTGGARRLVFAVR